MHPYRLLLSAVLSARLVLPAALAVAAPAVEEAGREPGGKEAGAPPTAAVEIDGEVLFRVRGVTAIPARVRAEAIATRIRQIAADPAFDPETLSVVEGATATDIRARDLVVMSVFDGDARLEDVRRQTLAIANRARIVQAITAWREARSRDRLLRAALVALVATVALALALVLLVLVARRVDAVLERRYRQRVQSIGIQSFEIVQAERIWAAFRGMLRGVRTLVVVVLVWVWLVAVLSRFPWTRAAAQELFAWVAGPVRTLAAGAVGYLPNLFFLAVLVVAMRAALRLLYLFFEGIDRGHVVLGGFHREWAWPTYRIARIFLIAFALVVAYPYIPGSQSEAFKGVSLFLGLMFTLGSSSVVSNTIAGYSMIYRRTFKVGDRVKIDDVVGDVLEMRLQVTHLRSMKNEEVIVPNSAILGTQVVNYSSYARQHGLILHTTVGIGYETPWRQVEGMLLLAAERTPGLRHEPAPFVHLKALGDFAVTYELNAYCDDAKAMMSLYTALHRNILDAFNEFGVQIMTPAYEGDPAQPKLVPKDQWWAPPAKR
jgi:small-conductance mechanosensitive channel